MWKDLLSSSPFKICEFEAEPTLQLKQDVVNVARGTSDDFSYICTTGYDVAFESDESRSQATCTDAFSTEAAGVRACPGAPQHADFFAKTSYYQEISDSSYTTTRLAYLQRH